MELHNPVLVAVDVQNGFINEHSRHVLPAVARLAAEFGRRDLPIVFTKFINTVGSQFERLLRWESVREGSETDLHRAFRDRDDFVIEKNFYTAFTCEFSDLAALHSWQTIVVCGIPTESCVLKTAVDAFERNYTPIVVANACASNQSATIHQAGLAIIQIMIGTDQIMTTEELLKQIDRE